MSSRFQALALLKSGVPAVMVATRSSMARLELQRGSQSEYGGILERLARKAPDGVVAPPAGWMMY